MANKDRKQEELDASLMLSFKMFSVKHGLGPEKLLARWYREIFVEGLMSMMEECSTEEEGDGAISFSAYDPADVIDRMKEKLNSTDNSGPQSSC